MQTNVVYNEDCLDGMRRIHDGSIKLVLTDLPYGMTNCAWDKRLPIDSLWREWKRVLEPGGVTVLTSIQPFTTQLINSNLREFKYCWYWIKNSATGFCFAKYQPMRNVEDICVFYRNGSEYHPQGLVQLEHPKQRRKNVGSSDTVYKKSGLCDKEYESRFTNYPKQTLSFKKDIGLHPTQKPVALFEYLIKTYTEPGDLVLDCCMGSGTTAMACLNTGRQFIGFEVSAEYYQVCQDRIARIE